MAESPETNEVFGIARKLNKELEDLPLHSHATVISVLNSLMQHRQLSEQIDREKKKAASIQEQYEQAQRAQIAADAARLKIV